MSETAQYRKEFESELKKYLSEKFSDDKRIKVLKNKLKIKLEKGTGEIHINCLGRYQKYYLFLCAENYGMRAFFEENIPPYRPNFFSENNQLVMSTIQESSGYQQFGYSQLYLPKNKAEINDACEFFYNKIKEIYLSRVINFIEDPPKKNYR